MLKIFVRIGRVDMDGFTGRDHHPTREMEGRFVRVVEMETVPLTDTDETKDEGPFQVFTGVLVDANGEDVPGGEVELIDFEIESKDDVPVLFSEMLA